MIKVVNETITVSINKLVKGGAADPACVITPDMLANIEEVVTAMLDDQSLVVEVSHEHQASSDAE